MGPTGLVRPASPRPTLRAAVLTSPAVRTSSSFFVRPVRRRLAALCPFTGALAFVVELGPTLTPAEAAVHAAAVLDTAAVLRDARR